MTKGKRMKTKLLSMWNAILDFFIEFEEIEIEEETEEYIKYDLIDHLFN